MLSPTQVQAIAPATTAADRFTYVNQAVPTVTLVNPGSGPMAGGGSVVLTGTNFSGATAVSFGAAPAASFTVNSATQITVTAPPAVAGRVDVTVTTPYGTSFPSPFDGYTFLAAAPAVTAVSPATDTTAGGTAITITGSNFTNASAVYFGAVPALFTVLADNSITATAPVQMAGTVDVTVGNPAGRSALVTADHFTYTAASGAPAVTAVSPGTGPSGGGTAVTLTGTGFTGATAVAFGNLLATAFAVNSDTSITAQAPPEVAGTVDVQVTTPSGVSAVSSADHFVYTTATPTVTAVAPSSGPTAGGSAVVITGTAFAGASAVRFGTTAATAFTVQSATQIAATAPALAAGTYDVTITTPAGTSPTSSADQYTAVTAPAPTVTGLAPATGPMAGGTAVTITGTNFTGATAVAFGSVNAPSFTVNSATQVTVTAPAQVAGAVDVTVTTPSGASAIGTADQFICTAAVPTVSAVSSSTGPTAGGTAVTITGTGFTGAYQVRFGTTPALSFQVSSDTSITAISPLALAGVADVTVATSGGTSAVVTADQFTYTTDPSAPTLTGLSPGTGPASGGTAVTITGTNLGGTSVVLFGNVAADFTLVSATQITATAPFQVAGTVDVTVTTAAGVSAVSSADQFTYATTAPTVTGVSPNTAPTSGGTTVTVTGTGFTGAILVSFGAATTYQLTVNSDTSLTLFAPLGATGVVDVTVTTPSGTSAPVTADQFTYTATALTPTVTGVSPNTGPAGGGTTVTITGTNFLNAAGVYFGTLAAAGFTVNSATSITATAPYQAAGTVDVTVATAGGVSAATTADQFSYSATAPTVTAVAPNSGPTTGGTVVTVTGTNLNTATGVTFGTTAGTGLVVGSGTQLTVTAPALAAGVVDVRVSNSAGTSPIAAADQFTALASPTVVGLSPASGSSAGGTAVTVTGTNFTGLVSVFFGGTAATSITVNSSTQLSAVTPAQNTGIVDVTVATGNGTSPTSAADQFTVTPPAPTVTALSPRSGLPAGGGSVVITGTSFLGATAVSFGATAATSFVVNSATQVTATAPALTAGTFDVTVTTPSGTSPTSTADQYTAEAAPTVTGVSPNSGPTSGATPLTITGTNFTGATAVKFGTVNAASFTVNSATQITATSPASSTAGVVDVTVTTPSGTSPSTTADHFTYTATGPTVTGVSPNSGPTSGGTTVTITGTNFVSVMGVIFGTTSATSYTVNSAMSITVTAPAHAAAAVDVTVSTMGGTSPVTAADKYTYTVGVPTVTGVSPNTGPASGGTSVTITGTNFVSVSAVSFGGVSATSYTVNSATSITATAPAHAVGTADVTVLTSAGYSPISSADHFTYT